MKWLLCTLWMAGCYFPLAATSPPTTLDVVVTNKAGVPVSGLQQQDFIVVDNKERQKILSFREVDGKAPAPDPPTEIILLIDRINTSFSAVANERIQTKKFLLQNGGHLEYPVALAFASDKGIQMQNASQDGNALAEIVDKSESGLRSVRRSQGFYGAEDRLQLSLSTLNSLAAAEANKPGKKLLIWISPGWPMLSGPRIELTNKQHQALFNEIMRASAALWRARITLYSIDPLGTNDSGGLRTIYYESFLKGVKVDKEAEAGNLALQVLATQSGGRVFNSNNDIVSQIAACISDANAFYVISVETPPAESANELHTLEVRIETPGLKARTRTVYYAQP